MELEQSATEALSSPGRLSIPAVDGSGSQVKAVLWDFGGVLTSSPFDGFGAYERDHGLPPGFIRTLNATNPDNNAWAALERGHLDLDAFAFQFEAEARAAGRTLDARALLDSLRGDLRPAMVDALRRCHGRLKTALLTNNFGAAGEESGYAPVLPHVDVIVESCRTGLRKPDPEFYRLACRLLTIEPSEAVFLDDLGVNLKPARAMGMRTIKVVDPEVALDELEAVVGFPLSV
jgi:putative hydrolase of the HAD superfamily